MKTFGALRQFMINQGAYAHERSPGTVHAGVYIISPRHGVTVTTSVAARFSLKDMGDGTSRGG